MGFKAKRKENVDTFHMSPFDNIILALLLTVYYQLLPYNMLDFNYVAFVIFMIML